MNSNNDVKLINRSAILRSIYKNGTVSKSKIASELGLTVMTVNNLVGELCATGVCIEDGYASSGGRRAGLYRINPKYGYIIGIELKREMLVLDVYDLALNSIEHKSVEYIPYEPYSTIKKMEEVLLSSATAQYKDLILGVGIAVPGRVDKEGRIINLPDFPEWRGVELGKILAERVDAPVFVDNDTNALLMSAKWNGLLKDKDSVAYINADGGLGAAFIQGEGLFYGSNNRAMELGHITVAPDGILCRCGCRGCLEAYLTEEKILCYINEELSSYKVNDLQEGVEAFLGGDERAERGFSRAIDYILVAIKNTALLLDPEMIILQCKWLCRVPKLCELLNYRLSQGGENNPALAKNISLMLNADEKIIAAAAACIVIQNVFPKLSKKDVKK